MSRKDFIDEDGENRALRSFLMQYGLPGLTVGAMRDHMSHSGWGGGYLPSFALCVSHEEHLTKAGAQIWIRHLLRMEVDSEITGLENGYTEPGQTLIGAQDFLRWNRSQVVPLVSIPKEMGVYRKAIEIHKATEIEADTERMNFIEKNTVLGATYQGITSANVIIYADDWLKLGLRGAIDAAISRAENKEM